MKNVMYLAAEAELWSLGKHCFLLSLANRRIRMSKDEEMGKNERNNASEGSQVESKPK